MTPAAEAARPLPWMALLASGLLGFALGAVFWSGPTYSVEIGQVASGAIRLPAHHPLFIHHVTVISPFFAQLPAVLLRLGVPAPVLCVLLSGVVGALSFVAVSSLAWLWCRDRLFAIAMPCLFLLLFYSGHKYPLLFPVADHDTGVAGLFATILALALAARGPSRSAAVALGLLPAVHPTLALAAGLGVSAAVLARPPELLRAWLRLWPWLMAGPGALLLAALVRAGLGTPAPILLGADDQSIRDLVYALMSAFDYHRAPQGLVAEPLRLLVFLEIDLYWLALGVALRRFARPTEAQKFLIDASLAWTGLAVVLTIVDEASPDFLPLPLKVLIASRWLNLNAVFFMVAVPAGLWALYRDGGLRSAGLLLGLLVVGVLLRVVTGPTLVRWMPPDPAEPMFLSIDGLAYPAAAVLLVVLASRSGRAPATKAATVRPPTWSVVLLGVALLGAARAAAVRGLPTPDVDGILRTTRDAEVFAGTRAGKGLLIAAPGVVPYVQLRTGRGVVADTAFLDILPYVPRAAPSFERILADIYGTSLLPPRRDPFTGVEARWRSRTVEEWARIGIAYGATQVLAPADWPLRLPRVAQSRDLALYQIPAP